MSTETPSVADALGMPDAIEFAGRSWIVRPLTLRGIAQIGRKYGSVDEMVDTIYPAEVLAVEMAAAALREVDQNDAEEVEKRRAHLAEVRKYYARSGAEAGVLEATLFLVHLILAQEDPSITPEYLDSLLTMDNAEESRRFMAEVVERSKIFGSGEKQQSAPVKNARAARGSKKQLAAP